MAEEKEFFCSSLAQEYRVPLIGTATRGDIWFLIEYPGAWGAKAFEESEIPERVKRFLSGIALEGKRVRTLLIRQDRSRSQPGIRFFVGHTSVNEPKLFEYKIDDYADILDLDLSRLSFDDQADHANLREEPLYLVCTNGRRDKCCALYGPNVYQALVEEVGKSVWQSSHIGGHNQAPILLFFPHGVNYGSMSPDEARNLVQEYQNGRIVLRHYRGRVGYETQLQASEHFWRERTGNLDLPGMQIESALQIDADRWDVAVSGVNGERVEWFMIERRRSDFSIPITCTKKKERPIISFHRA